MNQRPYLDYAHSRERMIREQLEPRGIQHPLVLQAMRSVRRHLFVQEALQAKAYENYPLPIGFGQTISQPYTVGLMSQLLEPMAGLRVLEIGTGSGYQAAVLAEMGLVVFTIERIQGIFNATRQLFQSMGLRQIRMKLEDGTLGWPEVGPFDRIIVTAGGPAIPPPLLKQLDDPGIMLIPVGEGRRAQTLVKVVRERGMLRQELLGAVSFVDLVGNHAW